METDKPELLTNQGREPAAKGPMKSLVARGMHYIRTADGLEELYMLRLRPGGEVQHGGLAECSGPSRAIPKYAGVNAQEGEMIKVDLIHRAPAACNVCLLISRGGIRKTRQRPRLVLSLVQQVAGIGRRARNSGPRSLTAT